MSDKPISVGDLVVVVRSHCGQHIGEVHRVIAMDDAPNFACSFCDTVLGPISCALVTDSPDGRKLYRPPLSWLKRIPPLEELEGEKRDEEITA